MSAEFSLADLERRMDGAIDVLKREYAGLRTGRASAGLVEPILIDAYGARMPVGQLATVGVPEPRLITVQVWDKSLAKAVTTGIRDSGLGLNPIAEGQLVRVPIPELTEDRRRELARVAHKYAEDARVAVRNVRRDGMDTLKRLERAGDMSRDERESHADDVQRLTDSAIAAIGEAMELKEKDILQV